MLKQEQPLAATQPWPPHQHRHCLNIRLTGTCSALICEGIAHSIAGNHRLPSFPPNLLLPAGSPHPVYQKWIDLYGGEEFDQVVRKVESMVDEMAKCLTSEEVSHE